MIIICMRNTAAIDDYVKYQLKVHYAVVDCHS